MGKSRSDMRRRNPVTREMIERHRNAVHADKRKKVMDRLVRDMEEDFNADEFDTTIDDNGNVTIVYTGEDE